MLNLAQKPHCCQSFSIPNNFWNHREGTETGAFLWPSCYCFCKKWSNYNISSYHFEHKSVKSIILKSVAWTMIYLSQLSASLIFLQIFIRIQKKWCETQNLEVKFHFDVFWYCYPTRPLALWLSIQFNPILWLEI